VIERPEREQESDDQENDSGDAHHGSRKTITAADDGVLRIVRVVQHLDVVADMLGPPSNRVGDQAHGLSAGRDEIDGVARPLRARGASGRQVAIGEAPLGARVSPCNVAVPSPAADRRAETHETGDDQEQPGGPEQDRNGHCRLNVYAMNAPGVIVATSFGTSGGIVTGGLQICAGI
jgi:hypothetical protein